MRCQGYAQGVGRNGGNEHGGSDAVRLEGGFHQVGADFSSALFIGLGFEGYAEAAHDGEQDTTATSSVGRGSGRNDKVGNSHGVAKLEGAGANGCHDFISNALAQAGFNEAQSKEEGADNEPNRGIAKAGKSLRRLDNLQEAG